MHAFQLAINTCRHPISHPFQIVFTCCYMGIFYAYFYHLISSNNAKSDFPFKSMRDLFPKTFHGKVSVNFSLSIYTWPLWKFTIGYLYISNDFVWFDRTLYMCRFYETYPLGNEMLSNLLCLGQFTTMHSIVYWKLSPLVLQAWIDWALARLTWSFIKQSFLKQILTDGNLSLLNCYHALICNKWVN